MPLVVQDRQDAICKGAGCNARWLCSVRERGWREGSRKGKFPSLARKRQQAHTNRLLHMLTAPENELIVLNKEATELELMEQTLEAYLKEKSERRSSKKKRREMEGRVRSGERREGRKRKGWWMRLCVRKMIVCT